MKNIAYLFLAAGFLAGCKETDPDFDFKPLNDFKFEPATIADGTKIQIISFSGGPGCTPQRSYYYQFIGVVKGTQDTIRILSQCQVIESDPLPSEGSFSEMEKTSAIADSILREHGEDAFNTGKKIVVFNKRNVNLESRDLKTAVGAISF
jgi:hypothetical protein